MRTSPRRSQLGFTLVEMLVVIAILAALTALLVPAVQKVRQSADRTICLNNLKQMALACHNHHDVHDHFPSAGWGWNWIGAPHRANGPEQPGGWAYNLLPFLEKTDLRQLGFGKTGGAFTADMDQLVSLPVAVYNCPARRAATTFPNAWGIVYRSADAAKTMQTFRPNVVVRADYAGNAGPNGEDQRGPGPGSVADGDNASWWTTTAPYKNKLPSGVLYQRSKTQRSDIARGVANVFLIGERYLNPDDYLTGDDAADNETFYAGYNNDICRTTAYEPMRDTMGLADYYRFGGPHHGGFHMAFCDGSVRFIEFGVDPTAFRLQGCRALSETDY